MLKRRLEQQISSSLAHFPVVGIVGPRQCGKTTLANQVTKTVDKDTVYLDLESQPISGAKNRPGFEFYAIFCTYKCRGIQFQSIFSIKHDRYLA